MNFNQLMKQAQQMQRRVNKVKKELDNEIYDFESQQGAVQGKINGKLEIVELNINDQMLNNENKEILQDLIMVSLNETIKKINKEREDTLNKVTNGVDVSAFL
ncbi:MAG: YbaB/EbfC family nucleoid-associated protein [Coprobacillus sp.]|nr:YbaB/EbfC family nucleoid-associated protein [Coprobacillus sp.]